jgi:hypothetical protein
VRPIPFLQVYVPDINLEGSLAVKTFIISIIHTCYTRSLNILFTVYTHCCTKFNNGLKVINTKQHA